MASNSFPYSRYLMRKRSIVAVLKSAACEWVVILVMLFNAVVSYLINKFASYSDVQIPCVFCSRIDHALGNKKPEFNSKLLCQKHKVDISSMVLCVVHDKVANGCLMCEECLLSNLKKQDSTIYRALLSKGGNTIGSYYRKDFLRNTDMLSSVGTRLCSCCKRPWILRNSNDRTRSFKTSKPNIPLPNSNSDKSNDNWKHHRLLRGSMTDVEYSGLRFTSDSESEFLFSDEDDPLPNNDSLSTTQLISFDHELPPKDYNYADSFNENGTNDAVTAKVEDKRFRDLIEQLREDLEEEKKVTRLLNGELEEEREQARVLRGELGDMKGELEEERKRTSALLGELEAERNASAVAANETMAMITRLQEEKASLHMEALQYLRMMEEQAEYNVDALEKANDLLAEREKEIMEMEADIEAYQSKLSHQQTGYIQEDFNEAKMVIGDALKEMEMKVKKISDDLSCINEETHEGEESMDYLRNEACDLRVRVNTIESDWKFIKHAVKSLDYGEEGLRFVEQIACSLNELRKMGL